MDADEKDVIHALMARRTMMKPKDWKGENMADYMYGFSLSGLSGEVCDTMSWFKL